METEKLRCSSCRFWTLITHEAAPGCPPQLAVGVRSGWGTCSLATFRPELVRVKGYLETKRDFWCIGWTKGTD